MKTSPYSIATAQHDNEYTTEENLLIIVGLTPRQAYAHLWEQEARHDFAGQAA